MAFDRLNSTVTNYSPVSRRSEMKRSPCSTAGGQKEMLRRSTDEEDRELRLVQDLRSNAADLFLREQWEEALTLYTQLIHRCNDRISDHTTCDTERRAVFQRSLCLALSSRAETHSRLRDFMAALEDCDRALGIDGSHFKTLMCKGRILLHHFNCYSAALDCFRRASLDPQAAGAVDGLVEKCRKLEYLSRTGNFDLSEWVVNGFRGDCPHLAEFIGPVVVKKSDNCGRGLFTTRNIEAGTIVLATRAIAVERGIVMGEEIDEKQQLVMWKRFVDKVIESSSKCAMTRSWISILSDGEGSEATLEAPDMSLFRMDPDSRECLGGEVDAGKILSILDVNSLIENTNSAKVLGINKNCYGIGLWILPSFVNHCCSPNARRLHVGNHLIMLASRDVKEGEELTFGYFDVLHPLDKRREMAASWGFDCSCRRCEFEESVRHNPEFNDVEIGVEYGVDAGKIVFGLEECMKKLAVRGKEKGYLRASFWQAYNEIYTSKGSFKRWGRIPTTEAVVESIAEAVGSDERVLKVLMSNQSRNSCGGGIVEMERVFKLGRGIYSKLVKKQVLKILLEI